jgi:hypothetical protein
MIWAVWATVIRSQGGREQDLCRASRESYTGFWGSNEGQERSCHIPSGRVMV